MSVHTVKPKVIDINPIIGIKQQCAIFAKRKLMKETTKDFGSCRYDPNTMVHGPTQCPKILEWSRTSKLQPYLHY